MSRTAGGRHSLKVECLAHTPMAYEDIERWYKDEGFDATDREKIIRLCLSHERLRAETVGADIVAIADAADIKKLKWEIEVLRRHIHRDDAARADIWMQSYPTKESCPT